MHVLNWLEFRSYRSAQVALHFVTSLLDGPQAVKN
jgi:hypothetical protein